jgi:hypothetical protein
LSAELVAYAQKLEQEVLDKVEVLNEEGWEKYALRLKK